MVAVPIEEPACLRVRPSVKPELVSLQEAAVLCGVSVELLRQRIAADEYPRPAKLAHMSVNSYRMVTSIQQMLQAARSVRSVNFIGVSVDAAKQ